MEALEEKKEGENVNEEKKQETPKKPDMRGKNRRYWKKEYTIMEAMKNKEIQELKAKLSRKPKTQLSSVQQRAPLKAPVEKSSIEAQASVEQEEAEASELTLEEEKQPSPEDYAYQCGECKAYFNELKEGAYCPSCEVKLNAA